MNPEVASPVLAERNDPTTDPIAESFAPGTVRRCRGGMGHLDAARNSGI
jgi:hypothetical protein